MRPHVAKGATRAGTDNPRAVVLATEDTERARRIADLTCLIGFCPIVVEGIEKSIHIRPDTLIILECPEDRTAGLSSCRNVRERMSKHPILVVAPDWGSMTRALLLEAGADQVIMEPVFIREFWACVFTLTRRISDPRLRVRHPSPRAELWSQPDDDEDAVLLSSHGFTELCRSLRLTETERRLLRCVGSRGKPVSTAELLDTVFGDTTHSADSPLVRVHMHRLRRKLVQAGLTIKALQGYGYRVVEVRLPPVGSDGHGSGASTVAGRSIRFPEAPEFERRDASETRG
jgi:DNA-binding response OmpR family regulator